MKDYTVKEMIEFFDYYSNNLDRGNSFYMDADFTIINDETGEEMEERTTPEAAIEYYGDAIVNQMSFESRSRSSIEIILKVYIDEDEDEEMDDDDEYGRSMHEQ